MALNKQRLQEMVHQAFKKMQGAEVPTDAGEAALEAHFAQLLVDLSADLANAIADYIESGDVVAVQASGVVNVTGAPQAIAVNTTQTNIGRIQ